MAKTIGYIGTIESETRGTNRLWFSLTENATGGKWVKIGAFRAWFTMNMESSDRPSHMAQLTLILEALRSGLSVEVTHDGSASFHKWDAGDSFETNGIRILRIDLHF
jgi:hypothetical protein